MRAIATCRVSILRGTTTNDYDDLVDDEVVISTRHPASIVEQNRRVYLPAEGAYRTIRSYAGRIGPEVGLQKLDRLRDERTGTVYLVTEISDPTSPAMGPDVTFTASRTN